MAAFQRLRTHPAGAVPNTSARASLITFLLSNGSFKWRARALAKVVLPEPDNPLTNTAGD